MYAQRWAEGVVVDRQWIEVVYRLSPEWSRKNLAVHATLPNGRAGHLLTPEVVALLQRTRSRRRRRDTPPVVGGA